MMMAVECCARGERVVVAAKVHESMSRIENTKHSSDRIGTTPMKAYPLPGPIRIGVVGLIPHAEGVGGTAILKMTFEFWRGANAVPYV